MSADPLTSVSRVAAVIRRDARLRLLAGTAIAAVCLAAALLLRASLQPWLGAEGPFLLLLTGCAAAASVGGTLAGAAALVAGGALGALYLLPSEGLRLFDDPAASGVLVFYFIAGALIVALNRWRRSARRLAEARTDALRQAEATLKAFSEGCHEYAVMMLDREGRVAGWNPGARRLTGYDADEIVGRGYDVFFDRQSREAGEPARNLGLAEQTGHVDLEGWRIRRDGSRFLARVSLTVLGGDSGQPEGFACVVSDITSMREAEERARQAVARQRTFLQQVLRSVTEGRLRLCFRRDELPARLDRDGGSLPLDAARLAALRARLRSVGVAAGFDEQRIEDLVHAVGEAAMNAIVHAGGGEARIFHDGGRTMQVWLEDHGSGISEERLHLATLERGFTTAGSWGHGFWMMLKLADRVWLHTGQDGTTVVLEQERERPAPDWFESTASLDRSGLQAGQFDRTES